MRRNWLCVNSTSRHGHGFTNPTLCVMSKYSYNVNKLRSDDYGIRVECVLPASLYLVTLLSSGQCSEFESFRMHHAKYSLLFHECALYSSFPLLWRHVCRLVPLELKCYYCYIGIVLCLWLLPFGGTTVDASEWGHSHRAIRPKGSNRQVYSISWCTLNVILCQVYNSSLRYMLNTFLVRSNTWCPFTQRLLGPVHAVRQCARTIAPNCSKKNSFLRSIRSQLLACPLKHTGAHANTNVCINTHAYTTYHNRIH